ncbi:hypothetical protein [Aquabacterium sp.]|uniref:hypothetical protein n=1 Tax=Aquabacterium sp. TaxID=1872578 RepID=UPI004037EE63
MNIDKSHELPTFNGGRRSGLHHDRDTLFLSVDLGHEWRESAQNIGGKKGLSGGVFIWRNDGVTFLTGMKTPQPEAASPA